MYVAQNVAYDLWFKGIDESSEIYFGALKESALRNSSLEIHDLNGWNNLMVWWEMSGCIN